MTRKERRRQYREDQLERMEMQRLAWDIGIGLGILAVCAVSALLFILWLLNWLVNVG